MTAAFHRIMSSANGAASNLAEIRADRSRSCYEELMMADNNRSASAAICSIIEHTETALDIADQADEHLLAAKPNDVLICAIERLNAIAREGGG